MRAQEPVVVRRDSTAALSMGYQPSLDGLRAISVIAVLLYHAGFSWMQGGFFGVEVFFVVSGFLITSLLLDERERDGRIDFKQFWIRRIRRLFPALYAVLLAVSLWAAFAGTDEQVSQVRRDVPWAIFYGSNWGQIFGGVPYFAGEPPLLRHLWSLAVEEQWYLIWPMLFMGVTGLFTSRRTAGLLVLAVGAMSMLFTFWIHSGTPTPLSGPGPFNGLDRTNFLYLSTITRSGGLLVGAGAAFLWRPWRSPGAADAPAGRLLDPIGAGAVAALGCIFTVAVLTEGYVYQWVLPMVSVLSLVAILVAVHPAATGFRQIMSTHALVEIGKRSYGLYLWSWPISVVMDATTGSVGRFVLAMAGTAVVAEVSYRLIETPIRHGIIGRWWNDRAPITMAPVAGGAVLIVALIAFYVNVEQFNRFEGGEAVAFDLDAVDASPATDGAAATSPDVPLATQPATAPADATTSLPSARSTRLAIVGDSQANALAVNDPDGIEAIFSSIVNGSVDGCGVQSEGEMLSSVSVNKQFADCDGWQEKWAQAAGQADVALVVIGAWDVFDLDIDGTVYAFKTERADRLFARNLMSGIDAMLEAGAKVGLLEVACMRPVKAEGAGVRPLPERGDDARVAHLNNVIRFVSAQYGPQVRVIDGPDEWCNDEAIATNLGYRWDGVHVYGPGAKLIYEKIASDLLALAAAE
jgi:peptidoglycan/LPS O-acetylase OafA/YrhL